MSCAGQEKQRDDGTQQKVRRRALKIHHETTVDGLFKALKNMVCPSNRNSDASSNQRSPAKWKILDHAMGFLLEKEAYLSKLFTLKEMYLEDDGGPKSLEDVREHYRKLYSKPFSLHITRHSSRDCVPGVDEGHESSEVDSTDVEPYELPRSESQSSGSSVSNIQEFEGYLCFYSDALELLLHRGVLTPDQTSLSVVSEAISDLWSSLPPEQRVEAQQRALYTASWKIQNPNLLTSLNQYTFDCVEEELLQDAYDVVQRDMDAASVSRPAVLQSYEYEKLRQIYKDISGFIRNHMAAEQELLHKGRAEYLSEAAECEEHLLRCSESFDEDF